MWSPSGNPLRKMLRTTPINAQPEPQGRQDPVFTANAYGSSLNEPELAEVPAQAPEAPPSPAEAPEATPEVAFVREARQNDFWTSPLVRALLGLMGLALLAALMLQWVVRQKDVLAAHEPRLAPMLQALCRPLGCQIRPLRRIESLVIEHASFSKTGPDAYRLSFVFRNTGDALIEIPALEVTLIDSQDAVAGAPRGDAGAVRRHRHHAGGAFRTGWRLVPESLQRWCARGFIASASRLPAGGWLPYPGFLSLKTETRTECLL